MSPRSILAALLFACSTAHADACHWKSDDAQSFIEARDLPGMSLLQSAPPSPATAHDEHGLFQSEAVGERAWFSANTADQLWSVRDLRLRFATTQQAERFLAEKLGELSDDVPEVEPAEIDGVAVRIFGPRNAKAEFFARATGKKAETIVGYTYVFEVGPTVAKVLLSQGGNSHTKLKRMDHAEVVRAAIARVKGLCGA
ncbi:MAG TPA: hypothetical protein VF798_12040 [Burkholderiaceae bacterium]